VAFVAPLKALKDRLSQRLRARLGGAEPDASSFLRENWQIDFFESSSDCMALIHEKTAAILSINSAFTRQLGYESEDIVGRPAPSFPIFQDATCSHRLMADLYGKKKDGVVESITLIRKDATLPSEKNYSARCSIANKSFSRCLNTASMPSRLVAPITGAS